MIKISFLQNESKFVAPQNGSPTDSLIIILKRNSNEPWEWKTFE